MKIQVNTDNHITATTTLVADVENTVGRTLRRFQDHITRVEVHLSDVNSSKSGPDDKRCLIEARVNGMSPITASHEAPTLSLAVDGAGDRISAALDSALGRRNDVRRTDAAAGSASQANVADPTDSPDPSSKPD